MANIRAQEDIRRGLEALLAADPALVPVADAAGPVPLRLSEPGYAGLAHIVVSQLISRAAAQAIWARMAAEGPVTAASFRGLDDEGMRRFGLSRAKAATLRRVAVEVDEGRLDLAALCGLDAADAIGQLTAIPGIGPWTAEIYLMFCAGHPDLFPAGDVALRRAVAHGLGLPEAPEIKALYRFSERWAPLRSVAARLFWAYYARRMGRDVLPAV
ncbi:DNA-3-methyladenine glycosylase [Rhizobiaceae bacterium BDR2-2]|uniref:DNA-3-methyladenine glycosylase II n=1 Tax=Ectorhizobium quercum TaxID=2965071 RepID=A0AAE3N5A4_9HYPH|nr:DNA-3-methyladenine glycosylase [Ectorhizobium quercum]MCX8999959.1 DNA-3-methyladenine glycosylase [Ectorhizobium quercum]